MLTLHVANVKTAARRGGKSQGDDGAAARAHRAHVGDEPAALGEVVARVK